MTTVEIFSLALALAMDAFAVSIGVGGRLGRVHARQVFRLAWHFGLFQALMPVLGWSAGSTVRSHIAAFDHWVAFALLVIIGAKMIKEAFDDHQGLNRDPTTGWTLVGLSVATSIDALAVGFSFSLLEVSIWKPVCVIGMVAGIMSVAGMLVGQKAAVALRLGRTAEIAGGLVLIGLGVNIVIQNGMFV